MSRVIVTREAPVDRVIIFCMRARVLAGIVVSLLLIAGALTYVAWSSRPSIVEISPKPGSENISVATSIRVVFSRPMDHASVATRIHIEPVVEGAFSWEKNTLLFIPGQLWMSGQEFSLHLDDGARAASWLAFPMIENSSSFKTSAATLAYLYPSTGPADIFAVVLATGVRNQYTRNLDVLDYSVNHNGRFFYLSARNSQAGADIYRVDRIKAESSQDSIYQPEKLLECEAAQCRNPVVSPDDQTLAYEYLRSSSQGGLGPAQIWMMKLSSLDATPVGVEGHETLQPSWSSVGLLAYYDRTNSGYEVFDPVSQERIQLPNQTGQPGAWSPDGRYYLAPEITYHKLGTSFETGTSHLIRYSIQDQTTQDISGEGSVEDVEAAYAPDGKLIAFSRKYLDADKWTLGRQVWEMSADGLTPHPLTNEADYNHYDLAWKQDGSMLAYVRFNQVQFSDPPELWLLNLDGTEPVQLVIGGYAPTWIP